MNPSIQRSLDQAGRLLKTFDFEHARALYDAVLNAMPNNTAALLGQALILNRTGQNREALVMFEQLLEQLQQKEIGKSPDLNVSSLAEVLAQMGLALQILGDNTKALRCYRESLRHDTNAQVERRIEQIEAEAGDQDPSGGALAAAQEAWAAGHEDVAARQFQAALGRYPDIHAALYGLGELHRLRGNLNTAQLLLQQASILQPQAVEYLNSLGLLFQQQGDVEKAICFYQRALNLKPRHPEVLCNLGLACKLQENFTDAVAHYRAALAIRPRQPEALSHLGDVLRLVGEYDEARKALDKALKLRPDYTDALHNLEALQLSIDAANAPPPPPVAKRKAKAKAKTAAKSKAAPKAKVAATKQAAAKIPTTKKTPAAKAAPSPKTAPAVKTAAKAAAKSPASKTRPATKAAPKKAAAATRPAAKQPKAK